jgi:hypothetical protein
MSLTPMFCSSRLRPSINSNILSLVRQIAFAVRPGYDGQEPHAFELTTLLASISVSRPSSSGLMADYVAAIRRFRYHLRLVLSNSLSTETYLEARGREHG